MFFMFLLGTVLYGTTVLIPQFLQNLLGYPAVLAGEALAGGGFIMMFTMPHLRIAGLAGRSPIPDGCSDSRPRLAALSHGDAFEPGHRFQDGGDAARVSDGRVSHLFLFRRMCFPMWEFRAKKTIRFPA